MDNQFISAPLLINRSSPYVDPKDQLIRGLQLKNSKLKTQLMKIQRSMQQKFQSLQQEQGPKKRESIFQSQQSLQALNNELANTYKRIKMYEYQIGKIEDSERTINVSQKSAQVQLIIKEKRMMADKLKHQLIKQQKVVQQNTKKIENGQKDLFEIQLKQLTEESKFYKEKVRFLEEKESQKAGNMKRQYQSIKVKQNQLLQAGLSHGQFDQMKQRAMRSIKGSKNNLNQSKAVSKQQANLSGSDDQIVDRTKDRYLTMMGQIALLQKMQNDHQKQLTLAEDQKQQAIQKNMNSRNKLIECENEIQNLQKDIIAVKNKVVPMNMKPLRPIRSFSSHQGQLANKIMPSKSTVANKSKGLTHILKFDEVGMPSSKGQRFTDRNILGKTNLNAKIIRVKVYLDKNANCIAGIQCIYSNNKKGADYIKKDKDSKEKQYDQEELICKGYSFVRSISGTLNMEDRLQSLNFTSSDGTSHKFGVSKTSQKYFNLDIASHEYPTCIFGSLLVSKQAGKKQNSQLQHLGFQIQSQQNDSRSINEFHQ